MSDQNVISEGSNQQLVLISGDSATGKSASLMNIPNQERWIYANCEAGKRLPFRNKFKEFVITDPYQVFEIFQELEPGGQLHNDYDGVIVDSTSFLMELFESTYVLTAADTQKAWGEYAQFFKKLMQYHVAGCSKSVIMLSHVKSEYDEKSLSYKTQAMIKGALGKGVGVESFFSTVVSTKKIDLKVLENQDPALLTITPQDEALGYKHVFQVQLTKDTVGERIRSPMGMFTANQTYMDNDALQLLKHLAEYYGD